MTPQQAADGLVEVMLADGQRMLVDFRNVAADNADVEADVIRMLLDTEETDGDVCGAVQAYAEATGLTASFFLGREEVIVAIGSPHEVGRG